MVVFLLVGCYSEKKEINNNVAIVEKVNGVDIYLFSKPITKYKYMGSLDISIYDRIIDIEKQSVQSVLNNIKGFLNIENNITNIILDARKQYSNFDGVIFNSDLSRCEIIEYEK